MFSLPFDYTREKLQSQGNKRRYSPTYECFTNTAAVVFPSFFSFFLFFLSFASRRRFKQVWPFRSSCLQYGNLSKQSPHCHYNL